MYLIVKREDPHSLQPFHGYIFPLACALQLPQIRWGPCCPVPAKVVFVQITITIPSFPFTKDCTVPPYQVQLGRRIFQDIFQCLLHSCSTDRQIDTNNKTLFSLYWVPGLDEMIFQDYKTFIFFTSLPSATLTVSGFLF